MTSPYYDHAAIARAVEIKQHREVIGGLWAEIGELQCDFLLSQGLTPKHRVLDIGCGSLRLGVKLAQYLDAGNYFGTDLNEPLIQAGYEREIMPLGLQSKLPRENLITSGDFNFSWVKEPFDFAIANSVFAHLPFNHMRVCLERLPVAMKSGARFFMTFFEVPPAYPTHEPYRHEVGGVTTYGAADPYHYRYTDIVHAAKGLPWVCRYIGEWRHPRDQRMVELHII